MDTTNITISQGLLVAVLGIAMVFAVLLILMAFITLQNKVLAALSGKKKAEEPAAAAPAAVKAPAAAPAATAKGSCGGVMLHDVPDRTAAMIMAIVADELHTSLNELRFISIQEVK